MTGRMILTSNLVMTGRMIKTTIESTNMAEKPVLEKSHSKLEITLLELLAGGAMTRDQMVAKLGIPRTTIYDGLRSLIQRNEVMKYPLHAQEMSRGRPKVLFSLVDQEDQ